MQGPRAPTRQFPGPRGEVLKVTLQGGPACSGAGRLAVREVGRGGAGGRGVSAHRGSPCRGRRASGLRSAWCLSEPAGGVDVAEDGCPVSVAVAAAAAGAGGPSPRAWVWAQRPCRGWACVSACACVWLAPPLENGRRERLPVGHCGCEAGCNYTRSGPCLCLLGVGAVGRGAGGGRGGEGRDRSPPPAALASEHFSRSSAGTAGHGGLGGREGWGRAEPVSPHFTPAPRPAPPRAGVLLCASTGSVSRWRLLAQPSSSASTEPRNAAAFSYGAPTAYAECSGRSETRARGPRWEGGFRAASGAGPEGPRLGPGRLVPARAPSRGQHVLSRGSGTAGPSTRHLGPFLLFHGINIAP